MAVVGFIGLIGSGKDTAANILVDHHGFTKISFANPLKDAVANIFGWDRELLEGSTIESRIWRELPDHYWSSKFGFDVTPRYMLQYVGTEVMRCHLKDDIWVLSALSTIERNPTKNYVFSDIRFNNEINALKSIGAKLFRVKRGVDPIWFDVAKNNPDDMASLHPEVHVSEYEWVSSKHLTIIENDDTIEMLQDTIMKIVWK